MGKTAKDVLVGSNVKLWLDGEELGTWTNFEATVTINYQDVQIGYSVDRTPVSWQGDGSLTNQATNSIGLKLFQKLKKNRDLRFVIEGEMTKMSSGEKQAERLEGITFDSLPLSNWAKGELVSDELSFRFNPDDSTFASVIE